MDINLTPIAFRPRPEVIAAIKKIQAANAKDYTIFTRTDAIQKALIEYAKTLPNVPEPKKE